MRQKILSVITALALCLSLLPGAALAAGESIDGSWTDGLLEAPEGWSESEDGNTITITTPEALAWLAVLVNNKDFTEVEDNPTYQKTVVLGADLDLGGKEWIPIGNRKLGKQTVNAFAGSFDGNGYTISRLTISDSDSGECIGLFGNVYLNNSGFLRDVTVEDAEITVDRFTNIGVLAGQVLGSGSISGCTVSGTIHCQEAYRNTNAGGMFGFLNPTTGYVDRVYLTVNDCFAEVAITGAPMYAGGFAGYLGSCGKITNCGSAGDVTMTEPYAYMPYAGGFLGSFETYNGSVSIESCYATGNVSLSSSSEETMICAGGFLGGIDMFEKAASIQGCMSSGNVEVIASENTSMVLVGGFIGNGAEDPILTVANSYSTGDVTAGNGTYVMCGGFIGYGAPTVQNCYSLSNVTSKNGALYAWAFGFSGWTVSGANFTNCYALGASMDGGTHTASFLNGTPTMNNCFYYEGMELNGTNVSNTTVTALSEDAIMGETAFSEFDSSVWQLSTGNIPILTGIPDKVEKTDKPVYLTKTVTFDAQGGTPVDSQSVAKNGKVTEPADPTRDGFIFDGWYREAACTTEWDFESDTVETDTILYAKWEAITYTVSFDTQGGVDVAAIQVSHGFTVSEPTAPTKDGFLFDGWYTDADCKTAYDFANAVTGPLTLYAKWLKTLPNPPAGDGDTQYQVVMAESFSEVPAGLIGKFESTTALEAAMKLEITKVDADISEENTAVYDVTLLVSNDGGTTWNAATKENFPTDGLTVTLPYPAGTDSGYTFTVVHMFTTNDFGRTPGETETPAVTNTSVGIRFTVAGLSPISVGWEQPSTPATPSDPSGSGSSSRSHSSSSATTYTITVEDAAHGAVTANRRQASSGSTVTLTVTPDSGYAFDTLTVTDSRGEELRLTTRDGGKYTFTMPGRDVTVYAAFVPLPGQAPCDGGAGCPSYGFTDVEGVGTWYHEAVDYVLRAGLMDGYGGERFGPNEPLTRAQFVQILFNKAGKPAGNSLLQYNDVAEGEWYTDAIRWAASQGIAGGYGNRTFAPNDNLTREQLAVMLWRYAGSPAATQELHFADAGNAGGYALDALRWAVANGVLNGDGNGLLNPTGLTTRAQAAQVLRNLAE
ncbi:hypothetical protein D3Z52_21085 [Clostridiaceae bacterium]|nr:hypothetical protein [Clostridiaceae bacterium]